MAKTKKHILTRRFWRSVKSDELARIYVSWMIRSLAISLVGIFVPIFMLKLGYGFMDIAWLLVWYFIPRALGTDYLFGKLMTKLGAHKTMSLGFITQALSLGLFATLGNISWPLWLLGAIYGTSSQLVYLPFHYAFAAFHRRHLAGSELGNIRVIERVGSVLGPVVGGLIAMLFGGQYIFAVGFVLLMVSGVPLLLAREVSTRQQNLTIKSLILPGVSRDLISLAGLGINGVASSSVWALYLGMFVLARDMAYINLGVLQSLSVVVAIAVAYAIGRFTDKKIGRTLLRIGTTLNALFNFLRIFVTKYLMALGLNIAYEAAYTAIDIPYNKGYYASADDRDDRRLAYLVLTCWFDALTKGALWLIIILVALVTGSKAALLAGFVIGALVTLLTTTERFEALD
ncbi:MFS transporter [Candidatus Saccharibacteria bacterium]|nr:MFS transporter [Candidatus Saccharibacteria bacterium]